MRIDEIVNKVFTRSFMGYDIEQVDVFLDEVIETLERYEAEKREMLSAMEYLMKKLEHGQKMPLSDMKKARRLRRAFSFRSPCRISRARRRRSAAGRGTGSRSR